MTIGSFSNGSEPHGGLDVAYTGTGKTLFWLALRTLFLTFLTLGFYRFWMKARLRRFYWSSIRVGGQPLEFTGTGLEMLLGFLIAVVFLAIYLGVLNLLLTFAGMALFQTGAFNISFIAVIPLIYYAGYRARRYLLSRTRWRGIRFGMERGAVDYLIRALGYSVLAVVSLGFLVPLMDFRLRKFAVDRSWYGDLRFTQGGTWTGFLRPWLWVYAAIAIVALGTVGAFVFENPIMGVVIFIGYIAVIIAGVHYSVATMRYAIGTTRLGEGVRFSSTVSTGRIIGIYVVGSLLVSIIMSGVLLVLVAVTAGLANAFGVLGEVSQMFQTVLAGRSSNSMAYLGIGLIAIMYILGTLIFLALNEVFLAQPVLQHYVETVVLHNAVELDAVLQRAHDKMAEAEGFADALDVGAAF
ncbi:MAG: DUF898 family protein [Pseudomonadota bacterium]